MSLRRPRTDDSYTPPPAPDIELVDVTRLTILLDTGVERSFDLENDHTYVVGPNLTTLTMGDRVVEITTPRVLCTEKQTVKKNKVKPSGSI